AVARGQRVDLVGQLEYTRQAAPQVLLPARRHVGGDAADARPGDRHARATQLGDAVPEQLARLHGVEEGGERAQLEPDGADAGQVVADAADLAPQHAQVLGALGRLETDQLLDAHDVAGVVEDGRDVVQPVRVRQDLVPGGVLRRLGEAAVEEADLAYRRPDRLASQRHAQAEGAVDREGRRPRVPG